MPAKGRRMASRQAELGRKRKRQHNRVVAAVASPSGVPTSGGASAAAESAAAADSQPAAQPQTRPVAAPQRASTRGRLDRPAAYNYTVSEMRRISIMAGVLLAGLVALSFAI